MAGDLSGGSSAGMAIHKSEGLVPINDKCESNIPGLYAAGDAVEIVAIQILWAIFTGSLFLLFFRNAQRCLGAGFKAIYARTREQG